MASTHPSLHHQDVFPASIRYPVLVLTYALLKPFLWLVDKAGYSDRLWAAIGRKMRQQLIASKDFGDYQPTQHDVVVCTYPKCGTNWAMQIAYQIAMRGQGECPHIHNVVPWPDFVKQELMVSLADDTARQAAPTGLRVIKTHLEWDRVPYTKEARYICIIRDPKDAFVSQYHFARDQIFGLLMPAVPIWLRMFCSDAAPFVWEEHLHGYWKDRHLPNLLILTFEEMNADLPNAVRSIAAFMGVELTEDEFNIVCEKSSFAYMKKHEEKFAPPAVSPWASPDPHMIRRGVSGGSSELITPEQQQLIDTRCRTGLQRLGSDFPFDEVWGKPSVTTKPAVVAESA